VPISLITVNMYETAVEEYDEQAPENDFVF
jgi:hypothetical protein